MEVIYFTSTKNESNINFLPPELLTEILHYFPFKELIELSIVCKEWNDSIKDTLKFRIKKLFHSFEMRDMVLLNMYLNVQSTHKITYDLDAKHKIKNLMYEWITTEYLPMSIANVKFYNIIKFIFSDRSYKRCTYSFIIATIKKFNSKLDCKRCIYLGSVKDVLQEQANIYACVNIEKPKEPENQGPRNLFSGVNHRSYYVFKYLSLNELWELIKLFIVNGCVVKDELIKLLKRMSSLKYKDSYLEGNIKIGIMPQINRICTCTINKKLIFKFLAQLL